MMHLYWKVLFLYGFIFWLFSCINNYLREPKHYNYEEEQVLEILEENAPTSDPVISPAFETIFLKTVAFVLTLVLIVIVIKLGIKKLSLRLRRNWLNCSLEVPVRKKYTKRIPIAVNEHKCSSKSSDVSSPSESDCSNLPSKIPEKLVSDRSNDIFLEKQCARLKEEITALRTSSSQEMRSLSEKVHVITKEKKELNMQLQLALKENRAAKQHLEEVLKERTELIQRLETATKEVKMNTKSKKNIIIKLEQAVSNMERLKIKFDQVSRDKEILEDKLKVLETEYNALKHEAYVFALGDLRKEEDSKEHAVDRQDCGDCELDFVSTDKIDFDITQSEKDMKKVQEKLLNLEKSLEKLKINDSNNLTNDPIDEIETKWNNYMFEVDDMAPEHEEEFTIAEKPSLNSICTEPECQLDHQECSKSDCLLKFTQSDEENESSDDYLTHKIVHQAFSEPQTYRASSTKNVYARSKSCENCDDRLSIITEQTSPSPSDEVDEDYEWEDNSSDYCKSGRVTCHPLFLEFVANNLETEI